MHQFFLRMIEAKWGMTVAERDARRYDDEEDGAAFETQLFLNDNGVTVLCLDVLARSNEVR